MVDVGPNHPVSTDEVAALEFVVRCGVSSPLKSWFKPKELARRLDTTASKAGAALGAVLDAGADDLVLERRPGGRGGACFGVRRPPVDVESRQWWVQDGTRTPGAPMRPSMVPDVESDRPPREWWIERGETNREAVPA